MKAALVLFSTALVTFVGPAWSEPLDGKSNAPDWTKATSAEKEAWISTYQFKQTGLNKAEVSDCVEKYASKPLFETNALSGVTDMCASISALPK